jgi:NTP pyrophosphatase (non-canonical NTP hydrolase)
MDFETYRQAALRTDYSTYDDYHTGAVSPRLDYATIGLVTEAAKILDIIKKSKKSLKSLDREGLKEELGDLLWYFNLTLDEASLSLTEIMTANLEKIEKKYPTHLGTKEGLIRGE